MTPKKAIAAYLLTSIIFLLGLFTLYENLKPQLAGYVFLIYLADVSVTAVLAVVSVVS